MAYFFWCIGVLVIALWMLLRPARYTPQQAAPFLGVNHAHRGLHTKDKAVPENSLPAFAAAADMGYGMELDIQLSKDGQVVVFHDNTLGRVCGVQGRVDAYTLVELRQMHLLASGCKIPLLEEVLSLVKGRVPLIIELKTGAHNDALCQKALGILNNYEGPYCVESFDPRIVGWFRRNAPHVFRGQLSDSAANFIKGGESRLMAFALGNLFTNIIARPHFIAYGAGKKSVWVRLVEAMGALRVCWTVRNGDDIEEKQAQHHAVIFEYYMPPATYTCSI